MTSWKTVNLGTLCTIKTGKKDVNQGNANGIYPFFTCAEKHTFSDEYSFDCEALLIAGNGAVGQVSYYNGKFEAYQRTYVLSQFHNVIPQYLFHILKGTLRAKLEKQKLGNTMPYIKIGMLTEFPIPLPPLPVQKAIVAKLDAAFASIEQAVAAAEQNAENAKQLFQSYLSDVFERGGDGWKIKKIEEIAEIKGGKRVPKGNELSLDKTAHPYLRVTDFGLDGTIDETSLRYITEDIFAQIKRYTINSSDLYVSIAGTIGRTGIIPPHLNGANLTENACKLVFKPNVSNQFVYWFTQTSSFFAQAIEQTRTAAQPKLALSRLEQIVLKIPDFAEQNRLSDEFQAMSYKASEMKDIFLSKKVLLLELKQSLLQKAFNGQLVDA